jgi:hypothetical protein
MRPFGVVGAIAIAQALLDSQSQEKATPARGVQPMWRSIDATTQAVTRPHTRLRRLLATTVVLLVAFGTAWTLDHPPKPQTSGPTPVVTHRVGPPTWAEVLAETARQK